VRARLVRGPSGFKIEAIAGTQRVINDVSRFFQKPFAKVIRDFTSATEDKIAAIEKMKVERQSFEINTPEIREYNLDECRLLAETMRNFRAIVIEGDARLKEKMPDSGISMLPKYWQGSGSIAARLLESSGAPKRQALPERDHGFEKMAERAYYGGRFEISRTGLVPGPIYAYDVNSAYPAAMLQLPCPLHTSWHRVREPSPGALYLAGLTFSHPRDNLWCSLPFRTPDHWIHNPVNGSGWYWSPEIEAARLLGAKVKLHEVWQAQIGCECEPYAAIETCYEYRQEVGKSAKGYPIKLGMNSLYGKFAQRVGARPFYDPVAAGLITAITRAQLIRAIALDPSAVIMVATDAVYSTRPLALDLNGTLGSWEKKQHSDIFIVQSGVYWFPKEEQQKAETSGAAAHKTRGISQGLIASRAAELRKSWADYLLRRVILGGAPIPEITIPFAQFIGLRSALQNEISTATAKEIWNKPLRTAGQWREQCAGQDCEHTNCGRYGVSFDWKLKRERDTVEGMAVQHMPITGFKGRWTTPYNPDREHNLADNMSEITDHLPDRIMLLDHD
jgi:DNA polymerase type B, organellar and viral